MAEYSGASEKNVYAQVRVIGRDLAGAFAFSAIKSKQVILYSRDLGSLRIMN
ncbi:MAG: hypothetical protein OXF20_11025 [Gammaproteobacteria bacterium]|nr:hypothetical protein [Gammaproteobacteria bacterium]